jgi:hypothetical protein
MVTLLLTFSLAQLSTVRVVVIDASAPDAIYEDVSRELAEQVVAELKKTGLTTHRIDENELPPGGCRFGPCLGRLAQEHQATVVVTLDAEEIDERRSRVGLAALWAHNGAPITASRYVAHRSQPSRQLRAFSATLARVGGQLLKEQAKRAAQGPPPASRE